MEKYNPTALQLLQMWARVDPEMASYLGRLKVVKCPECEVEQWTVDGKPMRCAKCARRRKKVDQPTIGQETSRGKGRRRKK